ncbi:MAG: HAD family hydrolase [Thermoplasmata archaeon]|nr:HAD family hydrolase [Thermoplasmata archaeon]
MPPTRYRALSLDLWFTTIYYEESDEADWRAARARVLSDRLRTPEGRRLELSTVERATHAFRAGRQAEGRPVDSVDPEAIVSGIAAIAGAGFPGGLEEASHAYSSAGLEERPPRVNPEAIALCSVLESQRIPLISITNTARREASWKAAFDRLGGPHFDHVVTSCEVGQGKPHPAIFREAARRLGIPPGAILHVGDRWELDVTGAQVAGYGSAIYRGLWSRYPKAGYPPGTLPENEPWESIPPSVRRLDRLEELLEGDLFTSAP